MVIDDINLIYPWVLALKKSSATGHMIIPYYQKQKEEKERRELDRLRVKCQSYIESGYYSDPQCEQVTGSYRK
jgi:hypothetical protein